MDVEFCQLTKDEQELILFLDEKKLAYSLDSIKHSSEYIDPNRLEGVVVELCLKGIIEQCWPLKGEYIKRVKTSPVYRLTDKGKELLEWM